jgi:hypothetical protein
MRIKKKRVKLDRNVDLIDCPYWGCYVEVYLCKERCGKLKEDKKREIICDYSFLTFEGDNGREERRKRDSKVFEGFSPKDPENPSEYFSKHLKKERRGESDGEVVIRDLSKKLSSRRLSNDLKATALEKEKDS